MILPPFFGLLNKQSNTEIIKLVNSYLAADVATYVIPTEQINVTYTAVDVLAYSIPPTDILVTYNTVDVLSYVSQKENTTRLSYLVFDVLTYELPPTRPKPIEFIFSREKDSLGVFLWNPPNNGKKPLIDYIIEYKNTGEISWTRLLDGVSLFTGINVSFANNIGHQIRVAATNILGTGDFTESSVVIPSGGSDLDCDLIFFADMNQGDRNQLNDYSCRPKKIDTVTNRVTFDDGDGAYGSSWYYDGNIDATDVPETYPHIRITKCCNDNWSLSSNFTLSTWIKPASIDSSVNRTILSSASESGIASNYNSWRLYHFNQDIYFDINGVKVLSATGLSIPTNNYTHIAVCRSKDYLSLFVDGIERSETYYNNEISINSNYLIIGAFHNSDYNYNIMNGRGYVTEGFFGNIDEVIVSKSAFYRGNFTPSNRSTVLDCFGCLNALDCDFTISIIS
jgi:hypothetical protein